MLTLPMKTPSPPSPSTLDPLSTSPERADERGARLPQHSPVVSSSKKRRQSHSTSATASVASVSKHGSSWDRRFSELVSLHYTILNVCLPSLVYWPISSFFSSSLRSCMVIVTYHRIMNQTPALESGWIRFVLPLFALHITVHCSLVNSRSSFVLCRCNSNAWSKRTVLKGRAPLSMMTGWRDSRALDSAGPNARAKLAGRRSS